MHRYSHLLTGAAPDLECASCLHVDDIEQTISVEELMSHALAFFEEIGETPTRVNYETFASNRSYRVSINDFRERMTGMKYHVGHTLRNLTITSDGFESNNVSDTWTPRSVVSVSLHGRIMEAFFQSPRAFDDDSQYLIELAFQLFGTRFASAYMFPFPLAFSPLAYCSGLSYSPNSKQFGSITDRDSERIANWANHCYVGHRASEGYLRDIYHINIVSKKHLEMLVGNIDLAGWIRRGHARGRLFESHGKQFWAINNEHLADVQSALDGAGILLSSFPPASK